MKRSGEIRRRTPMARGGGFRPPQAPVAKPPRVRPPIVVAPRTGPAPPRAVIRPVDHLVRAVPKVIPLRSVAYERAAKALGYCMRCGCVVPPLTGMLAFCHADLHKGAGTKTDVRRGWPGCHDCHEEVGRRLARPVRRAVELLLAAMTRCAILEAGTWPSTLPLWSP